MVSKNGHILLVVLREKRRWEVEEVEREGSRRRGGKEGREGGGRKDGWKGTSGREENSESG